MISPKISVVIPSYNKVKFVGQTLDSIIDQGYTNLEVMVQDGESTDGTLEIVKKYAEKYPKVIKWESKRDKGQLDAINKGLSKATGDILTYINADDVYTKNAFKEVSEAFGDNRGALWFAGRGKVVNTNGKEIAKFVTAFKNFLHSVNLRFFLLVTNYLMQPSVFITTEAYKKYGPFSGSEKFVMEYDLWLKLSKVQMPVVLHKYLSKFRIEPFTKTKQMSKILLETDLVVVQKYTQNPIVLLFHKLSNSARLLINKFV